MGLFFFFFVLTAFFHLMGIILSQRQGVQIKPQTLVKILAPLCLSQVTLEKYSGVSKPSVKGNNNNSYLTKLRIEDTMHMKYIQNTLLSILCITCQ